MSANERMATFLCPSASALLKRPERAEGDTMENKKMYSREEKIAYYELRIREAERKLRYLRSPNYQDWTSELRKELAELKAKNAKTEAG